MTWEVVKDEFPVPCDHPLCDQLHRRFMTRAMSGDLFHEVTRTQWLLLLNDERYGDPYDTKREAVAEKQRLDARDAEGSWAQNQREVSS